MPEDNINRYDDEVGGRAERQFISEKAELEDTISEDATVLQGPRFTAENSREQKPKEKRVVLSQSPWSPYAIEIFADVDVETGVADNRGGEEEYLQSEKEGVDPDKDMSFDDIQNQRMLDEQTRKDKEERAKKEERERKEKARAEARARRAYLRGGEER